MTLEIADLFADRESERYTLHARHLNEQMVRMLKTIGFDEAYRRASGQYLYDRDGERYLDLLSGRGVFAIGRNHPTVRDTLKKVLDSDLPNLVQMDVSALAGLLAERLPRYVPCLDKVFFANSGTEPVEAALKFARSATGRTGILYCDHAFHGLSYGSLSGDTAFSPARSSRAIVRIAARDRRRRARRPVPALHERTFPEPATGMACARSGTATAPIARRRYSRW
jgi:ornithine--oxo-acid transaminase